MEEAMSRTETTTRHPSPASRRLLALPVLGLLLAAAIGAQAGTADASAPAHAQRISLDNRFVEPYALVGEGDRGITMTGNSDDSLDVKQVRKHIKGEFLWFRDEGKPYVIQDPEVLAKVRAAWAPMDRLGEQMDAYGREMDKHGKAMDALGKEMGQAAAGIKPDEARMRALERQMNEVGRKIGAVSEQLAYAREDERPRLNQQMAGLNAQMSALGNQMGAAAASDAQRQAQASMNEVSHRMNEASKPMNELGKKMNALGKDMERESRAADKTVHALIRDAVARGLAHPAPQG
jgi:methyl-accepting chemotaxis protein